MFVFCVWHRKALQSLEQGKLLEENVLVHSVEQEDNPPANHSLPVKPHVRVVGLEAVDDKRRALLRILGRA
jgi:hypothetical protein